MEFYKERDFGELIGDTFSFFKIFGKNYLRGYIAINGALIILLLVVIVLGYGGIAKQVFGGNLSGESFFLEQYFIENQSMLIISTILVFVFFLLISMIAYSYPVLYMKRVAETGDGQVTVSDMVEEIKENIPNYFIFFVGFLFILVPFIILIALLSVALMVILVGFLLLLILIPISTNTVNFTLFSLFHEKRGFFAALGYSFRIQFSKKFWKYLGSTFVMYLLVQLAASAVTMIPSIFLMVRLLSLESSVDATNSSMMALFFVTYVLSFLCQILLINILYVNTGLMYYDSREDLHRGEIISEIENIGLE